MASKPLQVKSGSGEPFAKSPFIPQQRTSMPPCKNHDLCTKLLTHIECGFMLCILYVRNGGRYDGLRIRAGEHRRSIFIRMRRWHKASPPSRGRGSKQDSQGFSRTTAQVASFTGAWIETLFE